VRPDNGQAHPQECRSRSDRVARAGIQGNSPSGEATQPEPESNHRRIGVGWMKSQRHEYRAWIRAGQPERDVCRRRCAEVQGMEGQQRLIEEGLGEPRRPHRLSKRRHGEEWQGPVQHQDRTDCQREPEESSPLGHRSFSPRHPSSSDGRTPAALSVALGKAAWSKGGAYELPGCRSSEPPTEQSHRGTSVGGGPACCQNDRDICLAPR
jgi:hypothetical protein